jgi:hypothetical protein
MQKVSLLDLKLRVKEDQRTLEDAYAAVIAMEQGLPMPMPPSGVDPLRWSAMIKSLSTAIKEGLDYLI